MRRITFGLITPSSRKETIASRSAASSSRRQLRQAAALSAYSSIVPPASRPAVSPDAVLVKLAHLLLAVRRDPLVRAEQLEPAEGRVGGLEAGLELREPAGLVVAFYAQRPYKERQREPLQDERCEDHREGQEKDQVAPGERAPGVRGQGYGEGRRQGDRAPHAAPGHHVVRKW
jgi:hypothetical protein